MPFTLSDLQQRQGVLKEQLREQEDIVNVAMAKLHALQGALELIGGMIAAEQTKWNAEMNEAVSSFRRKDGQS